MALPQFSQLREKTILFLKKHKKLIIKVSPFIILAAFFYLYILKDLPNPKGLRNYRVIPVSTQVLDRNGKRLYEIFRDENRVPIVLTDLPPYVKNATIAIEDKDFYKHGGISVFGGVFRAVKDTFILRKGLQGGSTITQQLVKSALLTPERTIRRKIREIILALWTEQILSKNEILELYLNQIPYGGVSYGIEEAARTYFGKHAKELTIAEAAFLAGLPQAPSTYSPYTNPDGAKRRQREVLKSMRDQKFISKDQYEKALSEDLKFIPLRNPIQAPHFVFYVKDLLEKQYGIEKIEEGGLKVYTTLDLDIQSSAEAIMREEIGKLKKLRVGNGASLVTRPATGEILAMVGSADFFATGSGTFNVTIANRQPGSSIKPINYAIGIDRKLVTPATIFLDSKTCFPQTFQKAYCPVNYDNSFHGPVSLRNSLGNSYNIPAVKMLALNTVSDFVASAPAFLIKSFKDPSRYGLSLTLGGGEVKMTEMAQAFSSFANEGTPRELVAVLKIVDKDGQVLYEYKDSNLKRDIHKKLDYPNFLAINGKPAISKETAFLISHILADNGARSAAFGPSSALVIPKHTVSVKTGTTNDKRDNWTIGYTPNFLTVVWVGNNDNTPMHPFLTSGVTGAAPIWNRIMKMVLENQPDLQAKRPSGVVGRTVCTDTGTVVATNTAPESVATCPTRFEYMIQGTEGVTGGLSFTKEQILINKDTGAQAIEGDVNVEMQEKTVMKDKFSNYCVDCAHPEMLTPTPTP